MEASPNVVFLDCDSGWVNFPEGRQPRNDQQGGLDADVKCIESGGVLRLRTLTGVRTLDECRSDVSTDEPKGNPEDGESTAAATQRNYP